MRQFGSFSLFGGFRIFPLLYWVEIRSSRRQNQMWRMLANWRRWSNWSKSCETKDDDGDRIARYKKERERERWATIVLKNQTKTIVASVWLLLHLVVLYRSRHACFCFLFFCEQNCVDPVTPRPLFCRPILFFFDFSLAPGEEELRRRISSRWKIVADP